jgi:acyl-coenzyme A thioesterase PaaI-like protein
MTAMAETRDPAPRAPSTTRYQRRLDSIRDGTTSDRPFVTKFALPPCTEWSYGLIISEFTPHPEALVEANVVFGGYIACLVDHFAGLAMYSIAQSDDEPFRTTELSVSFIRPLRLEHTRVEARVTTQADGYAKCEVRLLQADVVVSTGVARQVLRKSNKMSRPGAVAPAARTHP